MTEQELRDKLSKLEAEYDASRKQILIDFALANQKYNVGDILRSSHIMIKVDKVSVGYVGFSNLTECVYHGVSLTRKLVPYKAGTRDFINQRSVVEKLEVKNEI